VRESGHCHYPYLVARKPGELAATWFCGDGNALRAEVARIQTRDGAIAPDVIRSSPFALDLWWRTTAQDTLVRDTGGEYLAVAILNDSSVAVASPILNPVSGARGFAWRTFVMRP
jgi:hypothetical protein